MADYIFEFTDTDDCEFVDWDCVWRSWTWKVFKTISRVIKTKYLVRAVGTKYLVRAVGKKTLVRAVGKKTTVVDEF